MYGLFKVEYNGFLVWDQLIVSSLKQSKLREYAHQNNIKLLCQFSQEISDANEDRVDYFVIRKHIMV